MKNCSEKEWDRFIEKWFNEAINDLTNPDTHIDRLINRFERTCLIVNKKTGRTTIAKCNNKDDFSSKVGVAIAYARYRGQEIPKVITE